MAKKRSESSDYDRYKAGQAEISRTRSASGRNIGELPEVADPERKLACLDDLRLFAESYFAGRFPLAWGLDHLDLIADLQRVILEGGQWATEKLPAIYSSGQMPDLPALPPHKGNS